MNQIISNKINNTRSFFKELTQATLESLGWTVNEEKGYLLATDLNNQSYLIHCTGQKNLQNLKWKAQHLELMKIP